MAIIGRTKEGDTPEARVTSGDLSGDEYMALVRSKDVAARIAAAGRIDAPLGALLAFAQDVKPEVRVAVASNPGIGRTTTVIAHLANDRNADVVRALVDNPEVPREAVEQIANGGLRAVRDYARSKLD
jgi:hypothetical protein